MAQVQGTCEDRFAPVRKSLQELIDSGEELGVSLYLNIDGEEVLDLYGGYATADKSKAWEKDTIANVWSTSKTASAFALLLCIDRGLIEPTEKVAKYWPEFAQNGKENVEVRHFLFHASGVSGWEKPLTMEDLCDVPKATQLLAEQAPWWQPGTRSGYHSLSMGHLIGALVQRVTGRSLGTFIVEELSTPTNADFRLGVAQGDEARVSDLILPPMADPATLPDSWKDPSSLAFRTFMNPPMQGEIYKSAAWRGAEIGAANGHTNARGIGRLLSPISRGGLNLLSQKTMDLIFTEQLHNEDLVLGQPVKFGTGFGLAAPDTIFDWLPEGKVCSWGGWGGSIVVCDAERKATFAYVMNKMQHGTVGNDRTWRLLREVYKCLGIETKVKEAPRAMQ